MKPYLFYGSVLPERAQISLSFGLAFSHLTSGNSARADVSIILNQAAVTMYAEDEWDIFDLRNVVKNILQSNLAMVGYIKGLAYDIEVTRVLNPSLKIDYVFGIDIPCIAKPREANDLQTELEKLKIKTIGPNGILLSRCFNDLISAMKYAEDTSFYCYRAIEALRHQSAAVHGLSTADKNIEWQKFREVSAISEETVATLASAAKASRHGEVKGVTAQEREDMFTNTWSIVDSYIAHI